MKKLTINDSAFKEQTLLSICLQYCDFAELTPCLIKPFEDFFDLKQFAINKSRALHALAEQANSFEQRDFILSYRQRLNSLIIYLEARRYIG